MAYLSTGRLASSADSASESQPQLCDLDGYSTCW